VGIPAWLATDLYPTELIFCDRLTQVGVLSEIFGTLELAPVPETG
jgi:hypothetical protein